jgi:hypothetical protein
MAMKRIWLTLSIILNIFLLVCMCFLAYYKRYSIVAYVKKNYDALFFEKNIEEVGINFGEFIQEKYHSEIQLIDNNNEQKIKIAVLGNSLSLIPDWNGGAGLAASNKELDYVHVLFKKISYENDLSIEYLVLNIADFERGYEYFDNNRLEIIKNFEPEIIIFQIGENVSTEMLKLKKEIFIENYIKLIEYCNGKNTIVCLPFWPDREKLNIITEVALKSGAYLVDLSHLGSGIEPLNFARSERKFDHAGVAAHPGDYGMSNIAEILYITIRKIIK